MTVAMLRIRKYRHKNALFSLQHTAPPPRNTRCVWVWPGLIAITLATGYTSFMYRSFRGKVELSAAEDEGY